MQHYLSLGIVAARRMACKPAEVGELMRRQGWAANQASTRRHPVAKLKHAVNTRELKARQAGLALIKQAFT